MAIAPFAALLERCQKRESRSVAMSTIEVEEATKLVLFHLQVANVLRVGRSAVYGAAEMAARALHLSMMLPHSVA
ncbi:hypothetical protein [Mycolicibacterium setense]